MINAAYAVFDVRPKAFDGIGMNVAKHIDFLRVQNSIVLVSHLAKWAIDVIVVRKNGRTLFDVANNRGKDGNLLDVGDGAGFEFAAALSHADNRGFASSAAPALPLALAAEITFVNLNDAIKWVKVFAQSMANFFAHTPRGFIGHARFALDLFGRDASAGLSHEVNDVEPSRHRGTRFLKDSASGRGNLVSAVITCVHLAPRDFMKQRTLVALRAVYSFRVFLMANVVKAYIIAREHLLKILDREFLHIAFHVITSKTSIAETLLVVKGYSPKG